MPEEQPPSQPDEKTTDHGAWSWSRPDHGDARRALPRGEDFRRTVGFTVLGTLTGLEDVVSAADVVVTGEGRLDDQTMHGKTPLGVAALCRSHAVPVVAVCGRLDLEAHRVAEAGFVAAAALTEVEPDLEKSIANAGPLLEDVTAEVISRILP